MFKTIKMLKSGIHAYDATYYNGYIWFVHSYFNLLYKINIETGHIESVIPLSSDIRYQDERYIFIFPYNNKIWIIPGHESELVVVDCLTENISHVLLPKTQTSSQTWMFGGYTIDENRLFLLQNEMAFLVQVNLDSGEVEHIKVPNGMEGKVVGNWGCVSPAHDYYLTTKDMNTILKFSPSDLEFIQKKISVNRCAGIPECAYVEGKLYYWCNDMSRELFAINSDDGKTIKNVEAPKSGYATVRALWNRYVILDFAESDEYFVYDSDLNLVAEGVHAVDREINLCNGSGAIAIWKEIDDKEAICFSNRNNKICIIDAEFQTKKELYLNNSSQITNMMHDIIFGRLGTIPIWHEDLTDLNAFMDLVMYACK